MDRRILIQDIIISALGSDDKPYIVNTGLDNALNGNRQQSGGA